MGTDGALVALAVFKTVCVRLAADGWVRFPDVPAKSQDWTVGMVYEYTQHNISYVTFEAAKRKDEPYSSAFHP